MKGFQVLLFLGLASVGIGYAGQIEIGGANGLSSNYITQGAGAVCAAGAGKCVTGSTTGWIEANYNNILFGGATNNGGATSPVPFTGYTQTGGEAPGLTATDIGTGTPFSMMSDGAAASNNASNNFWASRSTGGTASSITVPIGVYGVTDIFTMLDNQWGSLGGNDTTVTFNFGSTSNATSGLTSVVVALTDSPNNGSTAAGEMRAALSCAAVTTTICNASTNPHGNLQTGEVINGVTVNGGVVYNTFNYTSASSAGFYANTGGRLKLDDQQFVFGNAYLSDWLVSVTVTENDGNTFSSNPSDPSETALSAITVDTVVPEPTTVLLLLTGLGGIGFLRFRRS